MNNRTPVPAEFGGPTTTPGAIRLGAGATNKQLKWLRDLAETREMPEDARTQLLARLTAQEQANAEHGDRAEIQDGLTVKRATEFIGRLKDRPRVARANAREEQGGGKVRVEYAEAEDGTKTGRVILAGHEATPILPGSYGVPTPEENYTNDTTFFKVWVNEEFGKGWGVKMYVSDDRVKVPYPVQLFALERILATGLEEAAALFGHEFKRCGVCNRGLSNDESRALGIGPVCRRRLMGDL